ncbi:leucine-rich repeat-containing protein 37B-like, partial [Panthera pardus]|uniref:Leucine-rich repeat-containing protein 37B-like n=1 Tax=Panthera pardus TaxID=9691 RepID=A0A9W2UNT8_PANPR
MVWLPLRARRQYPTRLGRCAPEPPRVMSRLRLLAPLLLFMWQPLWLLVQAAQPPEWALDPAQLTSDPLEAAEPWSSRSSDPPPESPQALTPPAEPGGFNYPGSSAPAQMLAPPKELTETLVPFLDTDSFGELPPGPDEDLNDQLTQHQRLPEVVPVPGWDQNQTIAPPPQLKSKTKTVGLDQAEDHQSFEILVPSLDSQSSKPTKFIVSPLNLKKDLAQHRRLAKVVRTPNQFANKEHLQQQLQDDYLDSNMGLLYPEENLPMGFPGGPDQLPNFSEEAEISPPLQKTPNHLESPEEAESFLPQGEAQAQHPEPSEETETSLLEQEAPSQHPESLKDGNSANPQEAPAEPSSTPEEVEPSSVQQEASAHPTEAPEEVEPSPTPQEAPAQPPEPSKDIISQLLPHHE